VWCRPWAVLLQDCLCLLVPAQQPRWVGGWLAQHDSKHLASAEAWPACLSPAQQHVPVTARLTALAQAADDAQLKRPCMTVMPMVLLLPQGVCS
jgi:hypothetical protein